MNQSQSSPDEQAREATGRRSSMCRTTGKRWLPGRAVLWTALLLFAGTLITNGPVIGAESSTGEHLARQSNGNVTLNFQEMDIASLIQAVSRVTGRNFIVDPRVKARVTLISARPITPEKVYDVFLSVLQVHGFAAVEAGDVTKIVPEADGKTDGQRVNPGSPPKDEMVTEVVRLRHVDAAPLIPVMRQMMPQQAVLSAMEKSNALVMTDRAGNVERLKGILAEVDKPTFRNVEIIDLDYANAEDVADTLKQLFDASGGGGKAGGGMQFTADARTNSVLIGGDRNSRAQMRAVITDLDTPVTDDGDTRVFHLKYAKAEDMMKVLQGMQSGGGGGANAAGPGKTPLNLAADASLNALVVTASPERMRMIASVIEQLDVRRQQVLVEAVIAEVSEDLNDKLGTQLAVLGSESGNGTVPIGISSFNGLLSTVAGGGTEALADSVLSSLGDGANVGAGRLSSDGTSFAVLVSALSAQAGNNILSTPSLLTLDNEESSIVVGQNIPIVTGSYADSGSGTTPTNPFQTISREDIGIKLKVTPTISPDDTVRLQIEQEVSSLDNTARSSAGLITNKRNVTTTVQVDDGDVVVLGGLIDDTTSNQVQKVPGLGDLPLFGNLFRYRDTTTSKRNLMVFIRPLIVSDGGELTAFSDEQYRRMRGHQQAAWNDRSLGDPADWPVLPEKGGFLQNQPLPLPDNIETLMRMDAAGAEKAGRKSSP